MIIIIKCSHHPHLRIRLYRVVDGLDEHACEIYKNLMQNLQNTVLPNMQICDVLVLVVSCC